MTTIATLSPLSSPEQRKLAQYVDSIRRCLGPKFVRLGHMLLAVRDHRLYKKDAGIQDKRAKPLLLKGRPLTIDQRLLYLDALEREAEYGGSSKPWDVSAGLNAIRNDHLYRDHADSFEEFCMFILGLNEERANRYLNWTGIRPAPVVRPEEIKSSCVYFIECIGHDLIKIGFSDSHPKGRFRDLQIACPFELRLVAMIQGATVRDERALHKKFSHLWFRGEWFRYADDLRQFISENAVPYHGGHRWQLT